MSRSISWKSLAMVFGCVMMVLAAGSVNAASVGQDLSNPHIRDANDNPASIPDFGTHVISLFYADTSVSDIADPLSDAIKAKKYNKDMYRGVGVANMKDSAVPNFVIRKIIQGKIEKYKSTILTDVDLTLPRAWGLGTCKGKSVFILIGKDKKIKYLKYADKNNPWSKAEIDTVLKIMDDLISK